MREQAEIQQQWLKLRLERVLPRLMRKHKVQMWLVICREYNEDPVFFSLVSPTMFAARRRTIYVFFDRGEEKGIERLALGGGSNGGLYTVYRDTGIEGREIYGEGQWVLLKKLIEERKPSTIAIDVSHTHAFSDGLSSSGRNVRPMIGLTRTTSKYVPLTTWPQITSLCVSESSATGNMSSALIASNTVDCAR